MEIKACESEVLDQHFHSEEELQVELYSCGCCNDEEPCPHGYGYKELDVGDFDEQSTITLIEDNEECVDDCIDDANMELPFKLSKTQKKLKKAGKEKEV